MRYGRRSPRTATSISVSYTHLDVYKRQPKTIDNDLPMTDHCPGFGSAAKYIAATFAEIVRDCEVYDIPAVTIVEDVYKRQFWN